MSAEISSYDDDALDELDLELEGEAARAQHDRLEEFRAELQHEIGQLIALGHGASDRALRLVGLYHRVIHAQLTLRRNGHTFPISAPPGWLTSFYCWREQQIADVLEADSRGD